VPRLKVNDGTCPEKPDHLTLPALPLPPGLDWLVVRPGDPRAGEIFVALSEVLKNAMAFFGGLSRELRADRIGAVDHNRDGSYVL
jgi:hypothetical protein